MPRQEDLNSVFINDVTELKGKVETLNDVLNVMDWAIDSALEQLEESGSLSPEIGLLGEYRKAIKSMRKHGFTMAKGAGGSVQCPKCKANLPNVAGDPGDQCGWCGFRFG
jgi:hypothetical protein